MNLRFWRLAALSLIGGFGAMLAGCDDSYLPQGSGRSEQPISSATLEEMNKIDTTPSSPVLVRTYKKEAELEIWKMKSDGHYALLKTYPMCRWSGQLGPKKREGDMQVPEGFYTITPGQMNPNSNYYLAFNVGYPNAYDRALDRTGGAVMVHGVCSSAGCFSMTDAQVADIYAIARDAFRGGQRQFQLQSFPFRMTAENMAKYRLDPNIAFWKEIKKGGDYFDVTKTETPVVVCNRHYVFGATPKDASAPFSPKEACPALERDPEVDQMVAEKVEKDAAKTEALRATVAAIRTVYADGGQNPVFVGYKDTSDPDALMSPPQEIVLEGRVPAAVKIAASEAELKKQHAALLARIDGLSPAVIRAAEADARKASAVAEKMAAKAEPTGAKSINAPAETASLAAPQRTQPVAEAAAAPTQAATQVQPAAYAPVEAVPVAAQPDAGGVWGTSTRNMKKWLNWSGSEQVSQSAATAHVPEPISTDAPQPPRKGASGDLARKSETADKSQRLALRGLPVPPARSATIAATKEDTAAPAAAQ
jgi:murein L,D-transpeptidase YafK